MNPQPVTTSTPIAYFPITGLKTGVSVNKANNTVEFNITRTASKLCFLVENTSEVALNLTEISLGNMIPDKSYLFAQTGNSTPTGATMRNIDFTTHVTEAAKTHNR